MKRYMLFGYWKYYPSGGMHDFIDSFDTIDEAWQRILDNPEHHDIHHIYDLHEERFYLTKKSEE